MPVRIRTMTPGDKPGLMEILHNTPEFKPSEVVVAEELIDGYLYSPERSGYYALVAEVDSAVAGYVCYGPTPLTEGTWDVYWMAVALETRGQGIGRTLSEAAEHEITKAGGRMTIIETSSLPSYERTRRFYLNQGYKLICRIPDFYTPGDDKLIMQKILE